MSNDRRRERRRQRQRRRRRQPDAYEAAGPVEFPGMFGWLQRRQRTFFAVGILVLVASLGATFIGSQFGGSADPAADATATPAPAASPEPAPEPRADEAAPEADPDAIVRAYDAPPELTIDAARRYEALIRTERGDVRLELLPEEAPGYVNNFVFLARNRFYDGLTFHRVVAGFVAQAGDPTGTGYESSGYDLPEERNDLPFGEGVLSMAKGGGEVSGSQFFITLGPAPHLETQGFTVFGRVLEGMDVLRSLTERDPQQPGAPPGDRILAVEIDEQPG